jgi:hypothetical protein
MLESIPFIPDSVNPLMIVLIIIVALVVVSLIKVTRFIMKLIGFILIVIVLTGVYFLFIQ